MQSPTQCNCVCVCVCIKGLPSATERSSLSDVIAARSLWLRQTSSWRSDVASLSLLLLLFSAFDLPLSSPQAVSYCAPLSIWSSVPLSLQVCVCVCVRERAGVRDQGAVHFGSRWSFEVSAYIPSCPHCYLLHNSISSKGRKGNTSLWWCQHNLCLHVWTCAKALFMYSFKTF